MDGIYKKLGRNIKLLREKNGLTQKQLGDAIYKSEILIRKYESGNVKIPFSSISSICSIFKIAPIELFFIDTSKPSAEEINKISEFFKVELSDLTFNKNDLKLVNNINVNFPNKSKEENETLNTKFKERLKMMSYENLIEDTHESFSFKLLVAIEKITHEKTGHSGYSVVKDIEYKLAQLDISAESLYDLVKNKTIELSIESQLILLKYLYELDYDSFFIFCEDNKLTLVNNTALNEFVVDCYSRKIDDLNTTSFLAFEKYLLITFGNEIKDLNKEDLIELQDEVNKFLEFSLFKLQKNIDGEN